MGSTIQPLQTCLRACSRAASVPQRRFAARASPSARIRLHLQATQQRSFSVTPRRLDVHEDDEFEFPEEEEPEGRPVKLQRREWRAIYEMQEKWNNMKPTERERMDRVVEQAGAEAREAIAPPVKFFKRKSFWNKDEEDNDLITDEQNEDLSEEDDIMDMAHAKFEEYREYREYARLAAWEMPLLSKLARPFEPPTAEQPLRFRYTTYMGELHPGESKVVVELCPEDMPLSPEQQLKLKKLLGVRYNPETGIAKMSCDQFEHQAQNKRYLGDVINSLIENAKDTTDTFADVPVDTRHHFFKKKFKFPVEWRMTEERRQFLNDTREKSLLLDKTKEEEGTIIDGPERIHKFLGGPPPGLISQQPAMATVPARSPRR